jgi:excisionase family DNA binding protein
MRLCWRGDGAENIGMAEYEALITLGEAARRSGLAPVTLRQAARDGRLRATRVGEGRRSIFLVNPADLDAYLAGRKTWRGYRGRLGEERRD